MLNHPTSSDIYESRQPSRIESSYNRWGSNIKMIIASWIVTRAATSRIKLSNEQLRLNFTINITSWMAWAHVGSSNGRLPWQLTPHGVWARNPKLASVAFVATCVVGDRWCVPCVDVLCWRGCCWLALWLSVFSVWRESRCADVHRQFGGVYDNNIYL